MQQTTLYDILEVSLSASAEAIDASHQRLRNDLQLKADAGDQDARMRLVAVREAYQTLSDSKRRRVYDASLNTRQSAASLRSSPAHGPSDEFGNESRARKSGVIKGVIALGLVAIGVYSINLYREGEAERLRAIEAQKHAIQMEKLAIERAKVEADAAAQRQRELNLELQKQKQEETAARRRAAVEERAMAKALIEYDQKVQDKENERLRRLGDVQLKQQLETAERRRTLDNEKAQLRRMCQERYGRSDC